MGACCSSEGSKGVDQIEPSPAPCVVIDNCINLVTRVVGKRRIHQSTRLFSKTTSESSALRAISALSTSKIGNFDVFSVHRQCDEPLAAVGYIGLRDVAKTLALPLDKLAAFCSAVDQSMPPNDYHNKLHVADVLQLMLLQTLDDYGPLSGICKDPILRLSLLLGAFVHDLKHPGVSNAFLRATNDELVQVYGPEAPAEKMHFSTFLALMDDPDYDFLQPLTACGDRDRVIDLVEEIVSSTDMSRHSEFVCMAEPSHPEHNVLYRLCFAMKVADLSHCFRKFNVHTKFTDMLKQEFYAQGDKEKALGLPQSHGMSRDELFQDIAEDQVNFLSCFIEPLLDQYSRIFSAPLVTELKDSLELNIVSWSKFAAVRSGDFHSIDGKMPCNHAVLKKSFSTSATEYRHRQMIDIASIHSIEVTKTPRRSAVNFAAINAISNTLKDQDPGCENAGQAGLTSRGRSQVKRVMSRSAGILESASPRHVELDIS